MTGYVLATEPNDLERRRMELLFAYHGAVTIELLEAAGVSDGWRCLEIGAGGGDITRWLANRVVPGGTVVAVDIETHWLEPLQDDVVDVRRGDFGVLDFGLTRFNLVVAQMVLLHLPDPAEACRRCVGLTVPGGQIVIHDVDFTPLAIPDATTEEADGLAVMVDVMRAANIDVALGPKIADLLEASGAIIEQVESRPADSATDARIAAEISAITIDRFRDRTAVPGASIDAAISALMNPSRRIIGPTRWVIRARVR
ncbi:MAG: class I SAM-dependent methyltransferase [Candidatus Dormibacteria bacterium]